TRGGDGVGNGICKIGDGWEVDGDSTLNWIIAARGGDGICGSGEEYAVSGDGGGVVRCTGGGGIESARSGCSSSSSSSSSSFSSSLASSQEGSSSSSSSSSSLSVGFEVGESSSAPTAGPTGDFRRDYGFVSTLDDEIRRDPERDVGYGIIDTWDEMVKDMQGTPIATDVAGLSQRMTDFVTTVRQDTDEIYRRLDDAQDNRLLMSGQLNSLRRDRRSHSRTARLMESEARASREA
nr:hypothetical protein [Tanacetum cinerariifolium]